MARIVHQVCYYQRFWNVLHNNNFICNIVLDKDYFEFLIINIIMNYYKSDTNLVCKCLL